MRVWSGAVWLAALSAIRAAAQAPPEPVQIPTLRITVTLVQVDAVVTDSSGRHVMDLAQGDFQILQDGQPQPVTYFVRVPGAPPSPGPAAKAPGMDAPLTSTALTAASQVKRAIAIVVDDLALTFEDLVRTREALRRYVQTQMQPGDLVSIVRTGGGVAVLEQFTTDKRVLLEAVDSLKWRFSGRQGLGPIRPRDDEQANAKPGKPEFLDYGYTLSALGALGTIEQVIRGMKSYAGRKSVVFLSDDLRVDGSIHSAINHITDLANRSAVSIYAIDPGGLRVRKSNRDPVLSDSGRESMEPFPGFPGADLDDETARMAGLDALAGRTGGLFYHDRNDVDACVTAAADDQLGYYVLGYSPQEGTFAPTGKSKFHRITVRVTRPGLKARWKTGFDGVPDQLEVTQQSGAPKTREQQLLEALASPFKATGIHVRLTSMYLEPKQWGPIVNSMLHFEGKDVEFTDEAGTWRARLDVVWTAYMGVKKPMWQGEKQLNLEFTAEQYREAMRDGIMVPLAIRAPQPGAFLLRTVVRDARSERVGSASQYVDVPDTRKGRLGMTGIVLTQASAEVVKMTGHDDIKADENWTQGRPAIRRFRPGQGIVYAYWVINAKLKGAEKKAGIVASVRVFRNGGLIYSGTPSPNTMPAPGQETQLLGGGVLRLGAALAPGEYLLQIVIRDENGSRKAPALSQWIDFEVTGG